MTLSLDPNFADMFPDSRPIFVVGAARSGTSILGDALRYGAGIPGNWEGFLYSTAYLLLTHVDAHWQHIGPGLQFFADRERGNPDRERALARFDFHEYQRHCLRYFHEKSAQGEVVWMDKTPDIYMVHATPMLASAYPRARWIWVQRNGIEVLDSRRRTHPEMTFAEGCRDWARIVLDWQRVRPLLDGRWLAVDQHDIASSGEQTAARLADFLGLDQSQRDGIAATFRNHHPGRTTSRKLAERLTLANADWPEADKATFRSLCGEAMAAAGYAL